MDPAVYEMAEADLIDGLRRSGLEANVVTHDDWFRAILVRDRSGGEEIVVDLGYDYRSHPPIHVGGVGPVLDPEDIVTGKVRAFLDRGVERDYSDIDSILSSGRWSIEDLYAKARTVFPRITRADMAAKLAGAVDLDPQEYAAIGISPSELLGMHRRLTAAGEKLDQRPGSPNP